MSAPTVSPVWATNTNYSAGTYAGQTNKSAPPAGNVAEGFNAGYGLPAEWLNYMLNNHGSWLTWLNQAALSSSRSSFVQAEWSQWSGKFVAADLEAYAGPFKVRWTTGIATAPALRGPGYASSNGYGAPLLLALVDNNKTVDIEAGVVGSSPSASDGLMRMETWTLASIEIDICMSAVGANNVTVFAGLSNSTSGNFKGALFWKASANTNWQCKTDDGAATTTVDSGTPPVVNAWQTLRIDLYGSGSSGGLRALFYIDGVLKSTNTTNVYNGTAGLVARVGLLDTSGGANANEFRISGPRCLWTRGNGL